MHWFRKWWDGERELYKNEPGSPVVFIGWDEHRHWTASIARAVVYFYLREWKWVIGTAIALTGLLIALKKLG